MVELFVSACSCGHHPTISADPLVLAKQYADQIPYNLGWLCETENLVTPGRTSNRFFASEPLAKEQVNAARGEVTAPYSGPGVSFVGCERHVAASCAFQGLVWGAEQTISPFSGKSLHRGCSLSVRRSLLTVCNRRAAVAADRSVIGRVGHTLSVDEAIGTLYPSCHNTHC
jgi:hypothetical protein